MSPMHPGHSTSHSQPGGALPRASVEPTRPDALAETDLTRSRGHLMTELVNPASSRLDTLPIEASLAMIQAEDSKIHFALAKARHEIAAAIHVVTDRLRAGGRLLYVGAGTSGRLAMLDAVECAPTFQVETGRVQAIVAGGPAALLGAVEGAEDDRAAAVREIGARRVDARDAVFGISAGGTTPFVHAALVEARARGAGTIFMACVPFEEAPDQADVSIRVFTGPEVLTGSTRLKAGTATKLVLNCVTTIAMAQIGKVYSNLMVDLDTRANFKLVDRGARIVQSLAGVERGAALELLGRARGRVKTAVVMARRGLERESAEALLESCSGSLRRALE